MPERIRNHNYNFNHWIDPVNPTQTMCGTQLNYNWSMMVEGDKDGRLCVDCFEGWNRGKYRRMGLALAEREAELVGGTAG